MPNLRYMFYLSYIIFMNNYFYNFKITENQYFYLASKSINKSLIFIKCLMLTIDNH